MRGFEILLWLSFLVSTLAAQSPAAPASADNLAKAHEELQRGNADQAIVLLQQMAATQPVAKGVERELGLAYYRTSRLAEARDAFQRAMAQDPQDIEAIQMEGLTLYRLGQPTAAIPFLERVRQWTPDAGTDANYVLGLCYLNANRYDDARKSFAAQFGEPPDSGAARLLLASMLQRTNLLRQAAEEAQKALDTDPNLPRAHLLLGEVALLDSNVEEALKQFEAEQKIDPDNAAVYERMGDAYLRINNLDLAQQSLTRALSLDMSSTGPFILMGRMLLRRQDTYTAIMYLKHAEKMDGSNYVIHASLAQAYHLAGEEDEAKRENELAAQSHAGNDTTPQTMH
ncbi:MAG TPA: tetratricopeptide repeat protein [Acidobacteriaceae bacterium]|jgi:tetratricopeptide (TPR) repeat protein|nr:tetratricopeptide repeat protein [Acidobacteriaceae bacterium]